MVRSARPTLLVENPFEPGRYRFQLECVDDAGNVSDPVQLVVTVMPRVVREPREPRDPREPRPFDPRVIVQPDRPRDRIERVTPGRIRRPPGG